jgi:hypothetical protein
MSMAKKTSNLNSNKEKNMPKPSQKKSKQHLKGVKKRSSDQRKAMSEAPVRIDPWKNYYTAIRRLDEYADDVSRIFRGIKSVGNDIFPAWQAAQRLLDRHATTVNGEHDVRLQGALVPSDIWTMACRLRDRLNNHYGNLSIILIN